MKKTITVSYMRKITTLGENLVCPSLPMILTVTRSVLEKALFCNVTPAKENELRYSYLCM